MLFSRRSSIPPFLSHFRPCLFHFHPSERTSCLPCRSTDYVTGLRLDCDRAWEREKSMEFARNEWKVVYLYVRIQFAWITCTQEDSFFSLGVHFYVGKSFNQSGVLTPHYLNVSVYMHKKSEGFIPIGHLFFAILFILSMTLPIVYLIYARRLGIRRNEDCQRVTLVWGLKAFFVDKYHFRVAMFINIFSQINVT